MERINRDVVIPEMIEHVNKNILPQYDTFDKGHQQDHIKNVWENCKLIIKNNHLKVDINMIYVISHYHDLGLIINREDHHLNSAKIMENDEVIKKYFMTDEIHVMSEAIKDHRASNNYLPRTIYGKIIADGDRQINLEKIISRIIAYNKPLSPELNRNELFNQKIYTHFCEKYGCNGSPGYLELSFKHSQAQKDLEEISKVSEEEVFKIYCKYYDMKANK